MKDNHIGTCWNRNPVELRLGQNTCVVKKRLLRRRRCRHAVCKSAPGRLDACCNRLLGLCMLHIARQDSPRARFDDVCWRAHTDLIVCIVQQEHSNHKPPVDAGTEHSRSVRVPAVQSRADFWNGSTNHQRSPRTTSWPILGPLMAIASTTGLEPSHQRISNKQ